MIDFIIGGILILLGFWMLRIAFNVLWFYYRRSKAIKKRRYRESGVVMDPDTGKLVSQKKPDV